MATFTLNKVLKTFEEATLTPTDFLDVNKQVLNEIKLNIKEVYDFSKKEETQQPRKKNALQQLYVQNLDSEQIWQQVEIQNDSVLNSFVSKISVLLVDKDNLKFKHLVDESEQDNSDSDVESVGSLDNGSQHSGDNSDIERKSNDLNDSEESSSDNEDGADQKKNSVDDKFFKLSEMENFLKTEEKKLENPVIDDASDSEESEGEGSIDFFKEDDEAIIDKEEEEQSKLARFKDYFVAKDEPIKKLKTNKLLAQLEEEGDVETDEDEPREEIKSSLKIRQEHLKKKIDKLEEQAVSEKPWQLKGEISADNRPQNSLLEEVVGFDLTSRPAPVITEQTSLQLEDIIRQRIKDKVFDSVERKSKPIDTPLEYRKKLVLNQEKSKQSLTQIYEQDYVKQQAELDPASVEQEEEEPKLHGEVRTMMTSVFAKLDALSNFHFTSKPTVPELKIISHLPAVNMEEVAPVVASDATLLAPEEIKKKTKNIIGRGERTTSDKKRERRQKKMKQKIHSKLKLKKETAMKETGKLKKGLQKTT